MSGSILKTKQIDSVVVNEGIKKAFREVIYYDVMTEAFKTAHKEALKELFNEKWILVKVETDDTAGSFYYNAECGIAIPVGDNLGIFDTFLGQESCLLTDKEAAKVFSDAFPEALKGLLKDLKLYQDNHWIGIEGGSYCFETHQYSDWNDDDSVHMTIIRLSRTRLDEKLKDASLTIDCNYMLNEFYAYYSSIKEPKLSKENLETILRILSADFENINDKTDQLLSELDTLVPQEQEALVKYLLDSDKKRVELESYDRKILDDINAGHWELWDEDTDQSDEEQVSCYPLIARNPVADIVEDGLVGIDFGTKSTIVSVENGSAKTTLLRVGVGKLSSTVEKHHYENPTIMEFVNLEQFMDAYDQYAGRPYTSVQDVTVSHKANNNLKECSESDYFYSYFYDIKQWCGNTGREIKIIDQNGKERLLPAFVALKDGDFNPLEIYAYFLGLYINNMRNGIYMEYVLSFPVTYTKEVKQKILSSFTKGLKKSLPAPVLNNSEAMKRFRVTQGVSEPAAYAITALKEYGFEPDEDTDEKIFYGIFDFGGGTTDFDFGIYRCPKDTREEARYDYIIEQFGSEGDRYLGGENLLELMAFEIFKANASRLQPQNNEGMVSAGFSFSKPAECEAFPGSETLISSSQEARRNTKQLMEVLRPFWEGIVDFESDRNETVEEAEECAVKESVADICEVAEEVVLEAAEEEVLEAVEIAAIKAVQELNSAYDNGLVTYGEYVFRNSKVVRDITQNGMVEVDLFDREGKPQQKQILYIEKADQDIFVDLLSILEKRIDRGVTAFFDSIKLAFKHHKEKTSDCDVDEIEVFLAGNSSKSPILRKCFDKHMKALEASKDKGQEAEVGYIKLYPPLGTEEANEILEERGLFVDTDVTAPTGKTGVAYGLIAGREGGAIKVIAEVKAEAEAKFRYNLGKARRGKFNLWLDRNTAAYGEWKDFIDAGSEYFEIFFTSMPGMEKQPVESSGIARKRCRINQVDAEKNVYIRVVSPEELEYVVSDKTPDSSVSGTKIRL